MVKVKTFTTSLQIFQVSKEITELDEMVNEFIKKNGITKVISLSDTCTTDDSGATIGIVRALAYE